MDSASTQMSNNFLFPRLNGVNWLLWKNNMRMTLVLRNLWDVIGRPEPEAMRLSAEWNQKQQHALALIHLNCEPEQQGNILDCHSGTEAWEALSHLYEAANVANVAHLEEKFGQLRKKENQSCQQYVSEVRSLAAQLAAINAPVGPQRIATKILHGLPREFDPVVFGLTLLGAPPLTVDDVALQVLAAEQRLLYHAFGATSSVSATVTATATADTVLHQIAMVAADKEQALAAGQGQKSREGIRESWRDLKCNFCGRYGHSEGYCFDKNPHLRPAGWVTRRDRRGDERDPRERERSERTRDNDQQRRDERLRER